MSDLFGNHIVGFPTCVSICLTWFFTSQSAIVMVIFKQKSFAFKPRHVFLFIFPWIYNLRTAYSIAVSLHGVCYNIFVRP